MNTIIVAKADDWIGVYVNGNLVREGHQIDTTEAMRLVAEYRSPITILDRWVNLDWMHDVGSLPAAIINVVWEGQRYPPIAPLPQED